MRLKLLILILTLLAYSSADEAVLTCYSRPRSANYKKTPLILKQTKLKLKGRFENVKFDEGTVLTFVIEKPNYTAMAQECFMDVPDAAGNLVGFGATNNQKHIAAVITDNSSFLDFAKNNLPLSEKKTLSIVKHFKANTSDSNRAFFMELSGGDMFSPTDYKIEVNQAPASGLKGIVNAYESGLIEAIANNSDGRGFIKNENLSTMSANQLINLAYVNLASYIFENGLDYSASRVAAEFILHYNHQYGISSLIPIATDETAELMALFQNFEKKGQLTYQITSIKNSSNILITVKSIANYYSYLVVDSNHVTHQIFENFKVAYSLPVYIEVPKQKFTTYGNKLTIKVLPTLFDEFKVYSENKHSLVEQYIKQAWLDTREQTLENSDDWSEAKTEQDKKKL